MSNSTTGDRLELTTLERIKGRDSKDYRTYGALTYGYTILRAHGMRDDCQPAALDDLLDYVHSYWGKLTAKRLQALHDTRPQSLPLDSGHLRREMMEWIEVANAAIPRWQVVGKRRQ